MSGRIEYVLEAYRNGLQSNKEKFRSFNDNYMSKLLNERNSFLSAAGLIATVVLALATVYPKEALIFTVVLIIDLIAGLVIYIVFSNLMREASRTLWTIEKTYHEAFTTGNFMKGFLGLRTLNELDIDQLVRLFSYMVTVQGGIIWDIIDKYKQAYQAKSFPGDIEAFIPFPTCSGCAYGPQASIINGQPIVSVLEHR